VLARRRPRREGGRGANLVEAQHPREVRTQEHARLAHHGAAQLVRRYVLGHERRHPPQRRLLLRELGQLVATCLDQALRLAQLGVHAPALGRVPPDAVHGAPLGHRLRVPLEPPHGAVGADDTGLERPHIVALRELSQRPARPLQIIRVEDPQSGSREELRLRVPQQADERRVHALELAVEAEDRQPIDREIEELLQLGLGRAALLHIARRPAAGFVRGCASPVHFCSVGTVR
jgi:hypothetical protein